MCKLDIEKVNDHLTWEFLINTFKQMGFRRRWLSWMDFCIKTTRFSIIVNGEPVVFFSVERGLGQGDPLSPFLLILAMEGLNSLMRVASQDNWIRGFSTRNRANETMELAHLLYADETVVFCEAKQEQICYLRVSLVIFEACSGLVNWRKSSIFPVKEVQQIKAFASISKCNIEELPTIYLGMPLGSKHKAVEIWDDIIERSEKKLAI